MEFNYTQSSSNLNDVLYEAQLIANAFTKTLEDNNCLLMLTIGLHQEIENDRKDVETLLDSVTESNNALEKGPSALSPQDILNDLSETIGSLKAKCFDCDLKIPSIDFDIDLGGALGKLKANLKLYKSIFNFNKIDLCQVGYSLQSGCVPDILKLITLLLTAYVSIMALKKLSNISISAFIKGVLSTLLSKLTTNLKITVNIGSSNISCLVEALREIALALPTQNNISSNLGDEENEIFGFTVNGKRDLSNNFLRNEMLDNLSSNIDETTKQLESVEARISATERYLNESFDMISSVVDDATQEINNYIQSLLSFQTFFECEIARSGMEVEESITMINKLIQVINLLSAVAMSLVKKDLREKSCKNKETIEEYSEKDLEDLAYKDLIEDYNQKVVEIIGSEDSNLSVLIHEKPKNFALPKIDLLDCSVDDFIESHNLPSIVVLAKKQLEEESRKVTSTSWSNTYILRKPSLGERETIENIVNLVYEKPKDKEGNTIEPTIEKPIDNPIKNKGVSDILADVLYKDPKKADLACKSVEDVMSILNSLKR